MSQEEKQEDTAAADQGIGRKRSEEELDRLNRTLRAHNNSSHAMVRATEEIEYLDEVCRIVVEDCGHAMVWIGYAEDDEYKSVRPIAYSGFEVGYLETLGITWADTERGRGPTGTAIRTGRPSMCGNMLTDPQFEPWREEALKRGYASSIVLPLMAEDRAFGAITIYSREPDPFSEDEIALLSGLADDLAYGIQAIRLRAEHAQAEEAQLFLLQCGWPGSGEDFFQSLARYLAETLSMDFVCIDRLVEDSLSAETLAVYFDGEFEDNISYALKDTPCGDVVGKTICCFPRDVRGLFPRDAVLQDMMAEGYVGTTLWSSQGQPIGLIALISRKPLENAKQAESLLQLVAIRAAGELDRKRAEDENRRNEARLESLLRLSQHPAGSTQELLDLALEEAIALTGSKIGYIYHYDEARREFTLNTWSRDVMEQCTVAQQETVYDLDKTGIWGEAVRQAGPIIVNDFHAPHPLMRGYPDGHAPLHKFMTLPVFLDGRIVGVVGVANKDTDYDSSDVRQLTLLMDSAWKITARKRAVEQVAEARADAERRAAQLESFITSMTDGVLLLDSEGNAVLSNQAAVDLLGADSGRSLRQRVSDAGVRGLDGSLLRVEETTSYRALQGETISGARCVISSPQGGDRVIEFSSAPVRAADGRVIGAATVFRDVTEQVEFERYRDELYEREHYIAEMLQQALIPPEVPRQIGDFRVGVRYQAALSESEVGGDFYDVFDLGDGKVGVLIGDVAGKGLPAAIRVAAARYSVRSYAFVDPRPSHVLTLANEALCKEAGNEGNILTAFFAVIDTSSTRVTYASAGHEPPLLCHASGAIDELRLGGMPLGVSDSTAYTESSVDLMPGDAIVMVTDGITEARASGSLLFQKKGMIEYLSNNAAVSPDETAAGLLKAATAFAGGRLQDDAAVVVVRLVCEELVA